MGVYHTTTPTINPKLLVQVLLDSPNGKGGNLKASHRKKHVARVIRVVRVIRVRAIRFIRSRPRISGLRFQVDIRACG